MRWPFKRRSETVPDEKIAQLIATAHMATVKGMDLFTIDGMAYSYWPSCRTLTNERGQVFNITATSAMFLAAHLNRMPVHRVQ